MDHQRLASFKPADMPFPPGEDLSVLLLGYWGAAVARQRARERKPRGP